ncbi:hypothetical protein O6H91_16G056000 [Diphasiastrum complanatum]|uniref:Uncharacterized protein n=3 Tax=Diphasiastrum complanatum TaxID=34168 RepID=A0ACC2BCL4_DIPCM|nr:hypothetical protein O6H91_16G056000 [Diphasiastrum complanatum]KAJ7527468.1 hypothetical protein O6H91_16G056000 [Diphasiastrum complanatum]KAJ7527469.1 hypothetical protein O6H91_16G056000 [Diphasiastrum complanatum]
MATSAMSLSAENSAAVDASQTNVEFLSAIVRQEPSVPQPSEALLGTAPPPFLSKTYQMIDDPNTDDIVSWSSSSNSFVVWNPPEFAKSILPNYFKHNNFSSFVRQLNSYGFRKVDPDRWEFAAEGFVRGQRHLLKTLRRRKPANQNQGAESSQGLIELGKFGGLEEDIEELKRDKNVLLHELVKMRQQQQITDQNMKFIGQRLAATEQRQRQMMTFLAKTMQNPSVLAHLVQQNNANKRIASLRRKRQLPKQEQLTPRGDLEASSSEGQQTLRYQTAMIDPAKSPFTDFLSCSEPASANVTCNLLEELFNGLEQENYGQGDETSISESDPNPNLSENFASAETTQMLKGGKGLILAHSSSIGSSSLEEVAGKVEKESLEGPEELEMVFPSYEQHTSTGPLPFILDSTWEDDWSELFESMEVYDKPKTVHEGGTNPLANAFAGEGTSAGLRNGEGIVEPEPPAQR